MCKFISRNQSPITLIRRSALVLAWRVFDSRTLSDENEFHHLCRCTRTHTHDQKSYPSPIKMEHFWDDNLFGCYSMVKGSKDRQPYWSRLSSIIFIYRGWRDRIVEVWTKLQSQHRRIRIPCYVNSHFTCTRESAIDSNLNPRISLYCSIQTVIGRLRPFHSSWTELKPYIVFEKRILRVCSWNEANTKTSLSHFTNYLPKLVCVIRNLK